MSNTKGYDIGVILDALASACRQLGQISLSDQKARKQIREEIRKLDNKVLEYLQSYTADMKRHVKSRASIQIYEFLNH